MTNPEGGPIVLRNPEQEKLYQGLIAGTALVPCVGGAVSALLSNRFTRLQEERFQAFVSDLNRRLANIDDGKLDKDFLASDEWLLLFRESAEKASRAVLREKLELFGAVLAGAAVRPRPATSTIEHYLIVAESLMTEHVEALQVIEHAHCQWRADNPGPIGVSDAIPGTDVGLAEEFGIHPNRISELVPGLSPSRARALAAELVARGLCHEAGGSQMGDRGRFGITEFGEDFTAFLRRGTGS